MTNIFKNTAELRKFVRINAQTDTSVWEFGVPEAKQQLAYYISNELLDRIELFAEIPTSNEHDQKLLLLVKQALAPMIMLNISAEMSLNIGDGGHSVLKNETSAPASDAKIQKYENHLKQRIEQNITVLVDFIDAHLEIFTEYKQSDAYSSRLACLFRSAKELQDIGLVNINFNHILYEKLRGNIIKVQEQFILPKVGLELYKELLSDVTDEKQQLKVLASRFCAAKAVAHYLKNNGNIPDILSVVPGYHNYTADADYREFEKYLIENANVLGVTIYRPEEFNKPENKIFSAIP